MTIHVVMVIKIWWKWWRGYWQQWDDNDDSDNGDENEIANDDCWYGRRTWQNGNGVDKDEKKTQDH